MPLFDVSGSTPRPFRRLRSGSEVYEREIEALFWDDLESFVGEALFPVARQPRITGGGIPDIVALDVTGSVVVVEVKRDVDRGQLAQCLEYAGWGRQTSLDELAALYHGGQEAFFAAWQGFTETTAPVLLNRVPRLVLVARSFHGRTESALQYLRDGGVPLKLVTVQFYEDASGARIVDVDNGADGVDDRPPVVVAADTVAGAGSVADDLAVSDLLEAGLVEPDEPIEWVRPQIGEHHHARIRSNGAIELANGEQLASLSMAANRLSGGSHNGWQVWTVPRLGGERMTSVRARARTTGD